MSGIFDNFQASLNRGVNAVGRSTQTAQLNMQLKDLLKQRQNLAAQLGASLYEITKDNAEDILKEEVGQVFAKVLEDAGVYKCTPQGREAFERFLNTVDFHKE